MLDLVKHDRGRRPVRPPVVGRPRPRAVLTDVLARCLAQAGEMVTLFGQVARSVAARPVGFWGDTLGLMVQILRRCWLPMVISTTAFGFGAPGLQAANFFILFGIPERLGSFFIMASVREFAPWINAMVVAGVVGSAITADLGARRIREEFDAMEVLGVDPVRSVIVPRIVAVTLMTGLMDIVALTFGVLGGWLAALWMGASSAAFYANFWANSTPTDLWGGVTKTFLFGLIIAVVCCYKGYRAEGGPAGVGRAVNQAVVIAFAMIYATNYVFTALLLGLNPYIQVYR